MADRHESVGGSNPVALAPVLGANRDGSATVDSSRSLLITVMGEFVLPAGGEVWTQTLIGVMELLGVQGKATRQALARMEKQEWLKRDRVGRRTRWLLAEPFAELLEEGADRIYGFGSGRRAWDGRWLVLMASVPERDRNIRYRMGLGLNWAGFGSLGQGLWICPWVDREPLATELVGRLGIDAISFRAEVGSIGSGEELGAQAWDLPDLRRRYDDFLDLADRIEAALGIEAATGPDGEALDGQRAVAHLADLVHHWRRFPFLDPDLPTELLPTDWPGEMAARRFTRLRARLLQPARARWEQLDAEFAR